MGISATNVHADSVLLNGVPVAGSPTVVNQVAVPDQQTLIVGPGASITTAVNAVIDGGGGTITVENQGTITSTGNNAIEAFGATLLLTNSGTISSGNFVGVRATTITSLVNSGTISGPDEGVVAIGTITSLINSGTITGDQNGVIADTITSLVNSGTIMSDGDGDGVEAETITSLVNTGTIMGDNVGVYAESGAATITSLINYGTITGGNNGVRADTITSLMNSGTIKSDFDSVLADTITSLVNSGTIMSGRDGVEAETITSLVNTGTIMGGAFSFGVRADTLTSLTNSGTITGGADGVRAHAITSLTNSGKITGGTNAIIESLAADTLLTLLPGSDIFGAIDLGGGTNTLMVGNGLSIDHVFAALPTVKSDGVPFVTDGTRVVAVDTTLMAQQDDMISNLRQGIWNSVFNNVGDGRNPASQANGSLIGLAAYAQSGAQNGMQNSIQGGFFKEQGSQSKASEGHVWASVFGAHRTEKGDGTALNVRQDMGGIVTGFDTPIDSHTRLGGFIGYSRTSLEGGALQESDVETLFGGIYGSASGNWLTVDFGVTGGRTDQENTRLVDNNQVNGLQTVSSNFDGSFVSPQAYLRSQMDLGGVVLQPTLSGGYTALFLDGYTETGTTAPLTVGDRDLHIIHGSFELAAILDRRDANGIGFQVSPYIGVEGRQLVDGETVNANLLGQNLSFNPGGEEEVASAFAGVRLSVVQTDHFGLFAGIEGSFDSEKSTTIGGNLGIKWTF